MGRGTCIWAQNRIQMGRLPTVRSSLRQTARIVVVDWDGTLVYSCSLANCAEKGIISSFDPVNVDRNGGPGPVALFLRPGAYEFLGKLSQDYLIGLWSFGVYEYVTECLQCMALSKMFSFVKTRVDMRIPFKDLYMINGDLSRVLIVDDDCESFGFLNPGNCIPIAAWTPFSDQDNVAGGEEFDLVLRMIPVRFQEIEKQGSCLLRLRRQRIRLLLEDLALQEAEEGLDVTDEHEPV